MVCVAVKGVPVIGVIHQPFDQQATTAWAWNGVAVSPDLKPVEKVINIIYV